MNNQPTKDTLKLPINSSIIVDVPISDNMKAFAGEKQVTWTQAIYYFILGLLTQFISICILSVLCYFPCKWAFPDNHLAVEQWFMVVIIAKILKGV